MTEKPMLMIVPSRSRPQNVEPLVTAWLDTGGFLGADLMLVVDIDDPAFDAYCAAVEREIARLGHFGPATLILRCIPRHQQLVPKLNAAALDSADGYRLLGFAGDDHLPRTSGWAESFVELFDHDSAVGIAYPDDGYQGEKLASSWVMSADIVRELGRMVPAPVEHLYCDNSIMDVGRDAGCLHYVPEIVVEHINPYAGKTAFDAQYERVNGSEQYRRDRPAYKRWKRDGGLASDAEQVRALIKGRVSNA
jgi:hypothetical protein